MTSPAARIWVPVGWICSKIVGDSLTVEGIRPGLFESAVVVANHSSFADLVFGSAFFWRARTLPHVVVGERFLKKALLSWIPWRTVGVIVIGRGEPGLSALRGAGLPVLARGETIALMPQGRFAGRPSTDARTFGTGAATLARESGSTLVPVGVAGLESIGSLRDLCPAIGGRGRVAICVGEPLDPRRLGTVEALHDAMVAELVRAAQQSELRLNE